MRLESGTIKPDDHPLQSSETNGSQEELKVVSLGGGGQRQTWAQRRIRFFAAILAAIPLTTMGVARQLVPSSSGLGTHQQLGLPPCSMRLLLGIRCPGCGMTTSWAHFVRGNWGESIQASAGGFLLAIFALLVAWIGIRTMLTGRSPGARTQQALLLAAAGIFAVALLQWIQRLIA